jgi:hypothetical protein
MDVGALGAARRLAAGMDVGALGRRAPVSPPGRCSRPDSPAIRDFDPPLFVAVRRSRRPVTPGIDSHGLTD